MSKSRSRVHQKFLSYLKCCVHRLCPQGRADSQAGCSVSRCRVVSLLLWLQETVQGCVQTIPGCILEGLRRNFQKGDYIS